MKLTTITPLWLLLKVIVAGPLPLVIWHGLGDKYSNEGLIEVGELYQDIYPDAFVHIIKLDENPDNDQRATFFGKLDDQIQTVCAQLAQVEQLRDGFHGVGFSQGGLFLRAYIERCNSPPVHTLVTFGSPHNGIATFGKCEPSDWLCRSALGLLRFGTWTDYVQSNIVPAQYFRNPKTLDKYIESSGFLADINNERPNENKALHKKNLGSLEGGLVLYLFENDTTVIPMESSWFAEVEVGDDNESPARNITWLRDRKMYNDDWLGLRKLDAGGKIKFLKTPGRHMEITEKLLRETFEKHLAQPDGTEKISKVAADRLLNLQDPKNIPYDVSDYL